MPRPPDVDPSPTCPMWIELSISWGDTPLHVVHLTRPTTFVLAESLAPGEEGFVVAARGGEPSRQAILVERDGRAFAVSGKRLVPIERGRRCRIEVRGLVVEIEGVAGVAAPRDHRPRVTRAQWVILAVSAALHVVVLAAILRTPRAGAPPTQQATHGSHAAPDVTSPSSP